MKISMLIGGLILFSFGVVLMLSFRIIRDYIITLYPLSGYVGFALLIISFFLIYKGIFSRSLPKYDVVASNSSNEGNVPDFEEWGGEEVSLY